MAALVGGFSAWFRPAGMARTMLGVAIMQALLAVAIATAPSSASTPDSSFKALLFSGFFHSAVAAFRDFLSCRRKTGSQGGCGALGIGCCAVREQHRVVCHARLPSARGTMELGRSFANVRFPPILEGRVNSGS